MTNRIHTTKPQIKVGDVFKTNCYGDVEVIEYLGANKIKVKFKIDGYERYSTSGNLQKGKVKNPNIPTVTHLRRGEKGNVAIGDSFVNSKGLRYTVVSYTNAKEVSILFDSGYTNVVSLQQVRTGSVLDNYSPSHYEGYLGDVCDYSGMNIAKTPEYKAWNSMIARCYSEDFKRNNPTYSDVTVCEEWLNFSIFAKWFKSQVAYSKLDKLHLDKDILDKHNTHYCPEKCEVVPPQINGIFPNALARRGSYPVGVYFCNKSQKLSACLRIEGKNKFLGYFYEQEAAFLAYKCAKENYIKFMADKYSAFLSDRCFLALKSYCIEITD